MYKYTGMCISHIWLFVNPWTVAHQAPLSMGLSRQEDWSGLPFPSPGDLPDPGIQPRSIALQADSLPTQLPGKSMETSHDLWSTIKLRWEAITMLVLHTAPIVSLPLITPRKGLVFSLHNITYSRSLTCPKWQFLHWTLPQILLERGIALGCNKPGYQDTCDYSVLSEFSTMLRELLGKSLINLHGRSININARHLCFSLVAQSHPTLCDLMDCRTPGLPVHHQFPEFTQTHVHRVADAIQPSHPLSSPSPPAPNPSQHQGLLIWVSFSHKVSKVLEFPIQHQSFQWTPRPDLL